MAKRKAEERVVGEQRRSSRRKANVNYDQDNNNEDDDVSSGKNAPRAKKLVKTSSAKPKKEAAAEQEAFSDGGEEEEVPKPKTKKPSKAKTPAVSNGVKEENDTKTTESLPSSGRHYWLMKAEPESRLEKGKDIKFSIDDLAAKTEPEPWDGIRAYPARNNLRAMKKGDLAFFYHSSCKVPAIVGIMEIVQEHTPDLSAHDPAAPYYDPKSSPEDPKWSVVHVEFRQKLDTPITLKELRDFDELKEMQMLKLTRLSVSSVKESEWRFLVAKMEENGDKVEM